METYTITTVDDEESPYYSELESLIRDFTIDIYISQHFKVSKKKKYEYIEELPRVLSVDDIIELDESINKRLDHLKRSIQNNDPNRQTRYYVVVNEDDEVLGFQTASVKNVEDHVEGLRHFAYMKRSHMGKTGNVQDTYGSIDYGFLSEQLYKNITKWFLENGVTVEKTAAGTNMLQNIFAYIVYKGFIPEKMDKHRVYFRKDYNKTYSKEELENKFEKYIRTRQV